MQASHLHHAAGTAQQHELSFLSIGVASIGNHERQVICVHVSPPFKGIRKVIARYLPERQREGGWRMGKGVEGGAVLGTGSAGRLWGG